MQIIRITSEALQATVRRLLPSQQGFGEDLQASNVIQPIIDLTPTAEGTQLREDLQTAQALGSQTSFNINNTNTVIVNTPGFWEISSWNALRDNFGDYILHTLQDGIASKEIYGIVPNSGSGSGNTVGTILNYTVFLDTDEFVQINVGASSFCRGSVRQIADRYGNYTLPSGFSFE